MLKPTALYNISNEQCSQCKTPNRIPSLCRNSEPINNIRKTDDVTRLEDITPELEITDRKKEN